MLQVTGLPTSRKTPGDNALQLGFAALQNRRSHAITWGFATLILAKPWLAATPCPVRVSWAEGDSGNQAMRGKYPYER